MKTSIFEYKIWKYIPLIIILAFTIEMSLIVTILLNLPQLLIAFIPLYLANILMIIKTLKQNRRETSNV